MRCDHCPTSAGIACVGQSRPEWCKALAEDPGLAGHVAGVSAMKAGGDEPRPPVPPDPHDAALWRAVRDCPHRERCGCQVPRCTANKGDQEDGTRATYARCLACVRTNAPPS